MMDLNSAKVASAMSVPVFGRKIWQTQWNMKLQLGIWLGLLVIFANLPTTTAVCESITTIPATTDATYGTLQHIDADDNNNGYVLVNPIHLVTATNGSSYVSQVTFDFIVAPQAGADMWLYVMNRLGSSAVFNPVVSFQIPAWAYQKGSPEGAGIQTLFFGPCDLPIAAGQYLAYGANAQGGTCYQTNAGNEYYIGITSAGLSTLGNSTYYVAANEGYAMSFVVSTVGENTTPTTSSSSSFDTITTYGTLKHTTANDINTNYVLINENYMVPPTCGTVTSSYVERVTFEFVVAPQAGAQVWLYTMNRNGDTNYFSPSVIYPIPPALIQTGSPNGLGVQTVVLNSTAVPVTAGQYVAVGFNSFGGSLYQIPDMLEYYVYLTNTQFATLGNVSYNLDYGGGAGFSFDVRTIGTNSP
jgi:hypothetical protein